MIKVKISDLLNGSEVLQKLGTMEFKAKLSWTIARLLKAADGEIQNFNDARMALIKKYGEKDENGELVTDDTGNCKIMQEKITDFSNELTELINSEVELNANEIDMKLLEDIPFMPSDMVKLEPFVNMDEKE